MKSVLVGCGKIADAHVTSLKRLGHLTRLVAVCDREPSMAEQLALRFGIERRYLDFDEMLEAERPDAVHITTPPGSHRGLAEKAFERGVHVYVEKPLSTRLEDDLALLELARESGRKFTVGYTYHFDPGVERLRSLVADGTIGQVVHAEAVYGYDLAGDYGAPTVRDRGHWVNGLDGGVAKNNLDHPLIDLAEWLDGTAPRVESFVLRGDAPGSLEVRATLASRGTTGALTFSCRSRPAFHRLTLYGTRDTATLDFHTRCVSLESTYRLRSAVGRATGPFVRAAEHFRLGVANCASLLRGEFGYFEGMVELMRRFYASIGAGLPPPIAPSRLEWVARVSAKILEPCHSAQRPVGGEFA